MCPTPGSQPCRRGEGRRSESRREGCPLSSQDLLRALSIPGPGVESLRKPGLAVIKQRRPPSVRLLFRDKRATPALLEFLGDTRVGRIPGLALFGVVEEESDLEEIVLWAEEDEGSEEGGGGSGPGPP